MIQIDLKLNFIELNSVVGINKRTQNSVNLQNNHHGSKNPEETQTRGVNGVDSERIMLMLYSYPFFNEQI